MFIGGNVHGRGNNEELSPPPLPLAEAAAAATAEERFLEKLSCCLKITIILKNKRKIGHSAEKKEKQVEYLVGVVKVVRKEEGKSQQTLCEDLTRSSLLFSYALPVQKGFF